MDLIKVYKYIVDTVVVVALHGAVQLILYKKNMMNM